MLEFWEHTHKPPPEQTQHRARLRLPTKSLLLWFCPLLRLQTELTPPIIDTPDSHSHISAETQQVQTYGGLIFHTQAVYGLLLLFVPAVLVSV